MDRFLWKHKALSVSMVVTMISSGLFLHRQIQQTRESRSVLLRTGLEAARKSRELEVLTQALSGDPAPDADENDTALAAAADLLREGAPRPAVAAYEKVVTDATAADNVGMRDRARRDLARALLAAGELDQARQRLQAIAAEVPDTFEGDMARFHLGVADFLAGDVERARAQWQQLEEDCHSGASMVLLCRIAGGKVAEADAVPGLTRQLSVIRALGYWLIAFGAPDAARRAELERESLAVSQTALPWLYCHLRRRGVTAPDVSSPEGDRQRP
jgi:hypothetical protein